MVPPASHRVSRVRWYSGYCCVKIPFAYRAVTYCGASSHTLLLKILNHVLQSATPKVLLPSVWPLSLSLAATKKIDVSFSSSAYLDVSVQRVPFHTLWIHAWITGSSPAWFPNSEICGSKLICSSPQLIAACHVLHRLLMPRHSPYALLSLNFQFSVLSNKKHFAFLLESRK